jgi:putative Mg2+ transporter-C (MgtC) family protein
VHPLAEQAADLAAAHGQGWKQVGELGLAFLLSSAVGLERQLRGKSAGLRTQTIVGTTAALMLLISKYGFADVLVPGEVELDPSRVAAQIVSGVGFLGAGLILTRRGTVHGLTTAAAVWEVAGIGMAAGAGLWVLAVAATGLHMVSVLGLSVLSRRLPASRSRGLRLHLVYLDGHGVLRPVIAACTGAGWTITSLRHESGEGEQREVVSATLGLMGAGDVDVLLRQLGDVDGMVSSQPVDEADDD